MADNRSIFEQMAGTLGSQYSQTYGILSRDRKKKQKKERNRAIIGSILFNSLSEGSKYLKNNLTNQIAELKDKATWDENYTKELWRQGSEIKAIDSKYRANPSYFYSMAAKNIETSPYGTDIARAGGVNALSPTAYKAYQDLVKAREAEYIANHNERMANPTAAITTFKEFSQGDRDMLTFQADELRDDLSNRNLFFAGLKKLGMGKDKEIEFNAELSRMQTEQEKRYAAAEAYIAPLDVTKFINYDVDGQALFTLGATVDRTKSDQEKTKLREELTNSDKNTLWEGYSFNEETGAYAMNSLPLDQLEKNNVTRHAGSPFKLKYLKGMKLQKRTDKLDAQGMLQFTGDDDPLGVIPYLVDDIYTKERIIEAQEKAQELNDPTYIRMSKEKRYGVAVQQLLNDGNIRFSDNYGFGGWNNYVYIPLNRNLSPNDLQNSKNPNSNINKADLAATIARQTEIENAEDFEEVYSKYLEKRTDAANISGDIEELEFLESIKGVESKASEEARLMFIINPPKELAGTMLSLGDGKGVVVGSKNENYNYYYELFKNNSNTNYGPSEAIEKLLNLKNSEDFKNSTDEDTTQVPDPVIRDNLKPKTTSDIYYDNDSDRSPASLLTQTLLNRPVRTITKIDEVLNKIDTVDSVKELKVFDSKITKAIRKAYKKDTGNNKLLDLNDLSLEEYKKYLTMYRSQFIDDNQDLFKESKPKSLLAGN